MIEGIEFDGTGAYGMPRAVYSDEGMVKQGLSIEGMQRIGY